QAEDPVGQLRRLLRPGRHVKIAPGILFAAGLLFARFNLCDVRAAEAPVKIRIGYPSAAVSTLPFDIAREKGFYQKAGLDVEAIQMRRAIGPQAVINAAVAGMPLVVVLSLYRDTPWVLVTTREIAKGQDLVGKKIAISDIRSSP